MLKVELYKYLKSPIIRITVLLPIILISFMLFVLPDISSEKKAYIFYVVTCNLFYTFIVPLYILFSCRQMSEYEYKNRNWKQLMCMPVSKSAIYSGKVMILSGSLCILYITFLMGILIVGRWSGFHFIGEGLASELTLSFLCAGLLVSVFYFLSLIDLSLIMYLGCGIISLLTGFFAMQSSHFWVYFPLCYQAAIPTIALQESVLRYIFISIILAVFMYLIGFYYFRKKEWS